jgi:hypothetical protein
MDRTNNTHWCGDGQYFIEAQWRCACPESEYGGASTAIPSRLSVVHTKSPGWHSFTYWPYWKILPDVASVVGWDDLATPTRNSHLPPPNPLDACPPLLAYQ